MSPKSRCQVLSVDDYEDSCEMFSKLLSYWLLETIAIGTSTQPLFLIDSESFDQYLLDSVLADLNDWEFCCRIRNGGPDKPILFFSGAAYDADKKRDIAAPATKSLAERPRSV